MPFWWNWSLAELPKYAGKLLSKTLLRGKEISNKMHLPSEDSWMEELLGFHKDFSVPIFRCTQTHLFSPHINLSQQLNKQQPFLQGKKHYYQPLLNWKLQIHMHKPVQWETKWGRGKGGQIHTKDFFFCALIATLSTRIGFDGFFTCISQRRHLFELQKKKWKWHRGAREQEKKLTKEDQVFHVAAGTRWHPDT